MSAKSKTAEEARIAAEAEAEVLEDTRFRKVGGGEFFKFEKGGDRVLGHYMGYTFQDIKSGRETVSVPKYIVMPEGEIDPVEFLGSYALVEFFSRVPMGALVRVTYTGKKEKTASNFFVKQFDVELAHEWEMLAPVKTNIAALPEPLAPKNLDPETGELFGLGVLGLGEKEAIDV